MADTPRNQLTTQQNALTPMGGMLQPQTAQLPATQAQEKFMVVLVRSGVAPKKYKVPPGSTVEDLLHAAGATLANQEIQIGQGTKLPSSTVLQPNNVVFMVPKPKNA